jgi:hypothetical protein
MRNDARDCRGFCLVLDITEEERRRASRRRSESSDECGTASGGALDPVPGKALGLVA